MMPEKYRYSSYQIKRAMKKSVVQVSDNTYLINNKSIVINNKKNFRCDCNWANDNKLHLRNCSCILAVLHSIDKETFWNEVFAHGIKKKKIINTEEKNKLTYEGLK